jgi:predicted nucleotidyltransferase
MLDLAAVDLRELAAALEDNSVEHSWWLDPDTGELEFCSIDDDGDSFEKRGLLYVESIGSHEAYSNMSDFVDRIRARRPRELLDRAIQGRGAFRRFKDTLFEFPELREEWFAFHDRRMRCRAIEWLVGEGLVDSAAADAALADLDRDDVAAAEPEDAARRAAAALRDMYGERLADVVLFGSHAREDANPDLDIDLLVVLHGPVSAWEELRRMDGLLWQVSYDHGVTVSAHPVSEEQWRSGGVPVLVEARTHGAILS